MLRSECECLGSALQPAHARLVMVPSLELLQLPVPALARVPEPDSLLMLPVSIPRAEPGAEPPALPHCCVRGGCHRSSWCTPARSPLQSQGLPQHILSSTCQCLTAHKPWSCCASCLRVTPCSESVKQKYTQVILCVLSLPLKEGRSTKTQDI